MPDHNQQGTPGDNNVELAISTTIQMFYIYIYIYIYIYK